MKQWMLVSSLLGICSALPLFPQHAGIPGMGSISLERTRQLGGLNIPSAPPQALPYSYDPFHSMWGRSFLPSHTFLWMTQGPQRQETQQYEYAMPVHPPPLPSLQPAIQFSESRLPEQPFFQPFTNLFPTRQLQIPQYNIQPPIQQTFPQLEAHPAVDPQQQPLPAERQTHQIYPALHGTQQDPSQQQQQQQPMYPSLYYLPYVANQGAAPARLGIVSSEEMQGGGYGAPAYRAAGPDLFPMDTRFGNSPLNQPGDYTVEDDQLGITEQPDVKGGANVGANPSGKGNNAVLLDGTQGGALPNANSHLFNPAGQSQGLSGLAQATMAPHATQGPFLSLDAADPSMPLDSTMFPDLYTTNVGNEPGLAHVGQDAWHFQEP